MAGVADLRTYGHCAQWEMACEWRNTLTVVALAFWRSIHVVVTTVSAEAGKLLDTQTAKGLVAAFAVIRHCADEFGWPMV